ncbi:MAG: aminopeptidase P family protein [Deltaproteobacteria bacterium]|nr:aminopeptidase P family protein [Deltaproteobacteria bacterium]
MPFDQRIRHLQESLIELGVEGAVLFHSRDVYYYTGTAQPAFLIVRPDDYFLFVINGIEFAHRDSPLPPEKIISERSLEKMSGRMFPGQGSGATVATELDLLTVGRFRELQKVLGRREIVDVSEEILRQRMTKDEVEIDAIRRACAAVHAGHEAAMDCLRPGVTELELSAAVEYAQRLAGHDGMLFMRQPDALIGRGPFASGDNLQHMSGGAFCLTGTGLDPAVPVGASRREIQRNDLVVIDVPACVNGYHSDQSRTYCPGHPPGDAVTLYKAVLQVMDHLIEQLRPGMRIGDAFSIGLDKARELGIQDSYLRFPSGATAHFIGHGVGLDVNEPPVLKKGSEVVLQAGMTLALEITATTTNGHPVKIEDVVLVSPDRCRILTTTPRDQIQVPAFTTSPTDSRTCPTKKPA